MIKLTRKEFFKSLAHPLTIFDVVLGVANLVLGIWVLTAGRPTGWINIFVAVFLLGLGYWNVVSTLSQKMRNKIGPVKDQAFRDTIAAILAGDWDTKRTKEAEWDRLCDDYMKFYATFKFPFRDRIEWSR